MGKGSPAQKERKPCIAAVPAYRGETTEEKPPHGCTVKKESQEKEEENLTLPRRKELRSFQSTSL
jgi:hypothetical protein